ncbi:MAG TPA: hypothetical protein VG125_03265 [Pirellulales bacterium]|jgi:hypothetical protein|nr:hypothetical protein [Pirellulales bacterium]
MIQRLIKAIARPPVRWCKALGRGCERRLARRMSERYADEVTQFAELTKAIRELDKKLTARLDRQEGFNWDHVALARRLASLEDHVNRILDQETLYEGEPGRGFVCLASDETLAATTALAQLEKAG